MAGLLGIYDLIVTVILNKNIKSNYFLYYGWRHLSSGLCYGLSSLGSGVAIGIDWDAGVGNKIEYL